MSKTTIPTAGLADDAVDLTSKVTGTVPTANGGTGATSFTAGITMADAWRVTSNFSSSSAATADLGQTAYQYLALSALVDVTNVSTHKVRFAVSGQASVLFRGDSTDNQTWATFVRLGDT